MRINALRRPLRVASLLALAILVTPVLLFAHARLVRSTPAANERLSAPPTELSLWFSEKPELAFTTIKLADSAGHAVALGAVRALGAMGVSVPVSGSLVAGKYTVSWRTAASDGHASSGSYGFVVAASAATTAAPAVAPTPASSAADSATRPTITITTGKPASNAALAPDDNPTFSAAMRWAELVALMTLIGIVIVRLAVVPGAKWGAELVTDVNDRSVRFARAVLILFAVATMTRGFAQAQLFPSASGSRFDSLLMLVQHSRWGFAWGIGLVGVVVAFVGAMVAGRSIAGWATAALGLVLICVSEALTGHAGAVKHYAAAVAADVAHVLGAGGWLGGLTALLLCVLPTLKKLEPKAAADAGSRLLRAYHGAATECVTIVVLSAVVAVWVRFPTLDALWTTPYGQMLLRKLFFVVVVAGFGLYHWRRIVIREWTDDTAFRFKRTAIGELVFGAVVVAFTALLVSQPLP